MVRTDTSSFPSRAVCCAVVYSYAICYSFIYIFGGGIMWSWMPLLFVVTILLSSFARIYLGVHYPSDCIFGAIEVILFISSFSFLCFIIYIFFYSFDLFNYLIILFIIIIIIIINYYYYYYYFNYD